MITITEKGLEDYAKIAYEAYGKKVDFKNFEGKPMPKWEDLTPLIRDAWKEAITAVVNAGPIRLVQIGGSNNKQVIS